MVARPVLLRRALQSALRPSAKKSTARQFSSTAARPAPNNTPDYAVPDPARPTHFGFETVTEAEKRERVAEVFTSVAESYDRMNDLMSFGWHRIWK
jgi:2-methoxy-6-polyprenyl-1,4-benzoquinol methylase